jgi:hypothetical protein
VDIVVKVVADIALMDLIKKLEISKSNPFSVAVFSCKNKFSYASAKN